MRLPAGFLAFSLLLALVGGAAASPVALDKLERVAMEGQTYVRLRDWAGQAGLSFEWLRAQHSVKVANRAMTLLLTNDSKLINANGVGVWLSHPAKVRSGRFYVSLVDLKTALAPLATPVRNRSRVGLVAIDAGHGGRDRGFPQGSRFEKTYTLLLAQELRAQLTRAGIKSTLIRSTDEYLDLTERADRAAARKADLLISLHYNSGGTGNRTAQGAETFVITPVGARSTNAQGAGGTAGPAPGNLHNDRSILLGYLVQRAMVKNLALSDRGVRRARFEVLREARMPAVLVEGGFMSHPGEMQRILDPVFRRKQARAIADAIVTYKQMLDP
jgi:N-acetylmuramoyl-L-alanine amidase